MCTVTDAEMRSFSKRGAILCTGSSRRARKSPHAICPQLLGWGVPRRYPEISEVPVLWTTLTTQDPERVHAIEDSNRQVKTHSSLIEFGASCARMQKLKGLLISEAFYPSLTLLPIDEMEVEVEEG